MRILTSTATENTSKVKIKTGKFVSILNESSHCEDVLENVVTALPVFTSVLDGEELALRHSCFTPVSGPKSRSRSPCQGSKPGLQPVTHSYTDWANAVRITLKVTYVYWNYYISILMATYIIIFGYGSCSVYSETSVGTYDTTKFRNQQDNDIHYLDNCW
jgi:hypothetical protein